MTAPPPSVERPFVRVVVLNWNAAGLTARCVESLLATDYPADRFEVVVVDNGSIDGSVERLSRQFPKVRIVRNGANLGFAEGCNRAMRDLDGVDALALVNNDATVDPGWLSPMVERMGSGPRIGAVAPKILLADTFVTVPLVRVGASPTRARIVSVQVAGRESLGRCLAGDGFVSVPHPTTPLALHHEVAERGELQVPVPALPIEIAISVRCERTEDVRFADERDGDSAERSGEVVTLRRVDHGPGHRRINSLGLSLTRWSEGLERHYGERDGDRFVSEEVPGWSGGGVLLSTACLAEVGVFDPRWFAYYEDTDLAWRSRRRGWRTVTEPRSVIHHLHGATAGSGWPGFFLLNYRNWLLTVLRNGSVGEVAAAFSVAWRLAWSPTRRNVIGRVRRLQRPDLAITERWLKVAAAVAMLAPSVVGSRRRTDPIDTAPGEIGAATTTFVGAVAPRPPQVRPAGPTVVYVDVTETIRSGWRAGIQRVVTRLVGELLADTDLDVVLIIWSVVDRSWRRLDNAETARFLDPLPMTNHPVAPAPAPGGLRRVVGPLTRIGPAAALKDEIRRRRELARRDPGIADLLLDAFEPGSVFFDPDASWNVVEASRFDLLAQLRDRGVTPVAFVHDVLPMTNPEWFEPHLVTVFSDHVLAHVAASSTVLCNSAHTAAELARIAGDHGLTVPPVSVVGLGSDHRVAAGGPLSHATIEVRPELAACVVERPTMMVVGTIEPRKNHAVLLDAFDHLLAEGLDVGLVIVGRLGWRSTAVGERITRHPEFGRRLFWPSSVDDAELAGLYGSTRLVVVPSITEGYGLPVVEALSFGCVVVSSNGGALAEVGGDAVRRFDPRRPEELTSCLRTLLVEDEAWSTQRARAERYEPPSWSECAAKVAEQLGVAVATEPGRVVGGPGRVD